MLYERATTDALTTQFGLQKIIKEPTHILTVLIWYLRPIKTW